MKLGSRASKLAIVQSEMALERLGITAEIVVFRTVGDRSGKEVSSLGGRAFTRELDDALISGQVDFTVHSLKDIPVEDFPSELEISFVVDRGDPRDCLVSRFGGLVDLPEGAVVGTGSERRKAELLNLRRDLVFKPLRGNVPTRLEKLDGGQYDAIVTAKCALGRLGLAARASQVFSIDEMVPAAGQGAIAVVTRKGEELNVSGSISDHMQACMLERAFIHGLGACRNPVGAYCRGDNGNFVLHGLFYRESERVSRVFNGRYNNVLADIQDWKADIL